MKDIALNEGLTEHDTAVPEDERCERDQEGDVGPYFAKDYDRMVEDCNCDADGAEDKI